MVRNFRDTIRANRISLTGKNVDIRVLSQNACTHFYKGRSCRHEKGTIVEVSTGDHEEEESAALAASGFGEFGAMQINQPERCVTPRNFGVPVFDVADRGRRKPDERADLGERHPA